MGGGEGSSAREALKHKSMEKVVMCDIDQVLCKLNPLILSFGPPLLVIHTHIYNYNYIYIYVTVHVVYNNILMLQEVVDFCRTHLTVNHEAFCHKKLNLVINDAK